MFEAGLVDEWKLRTWMRMKAESESEQVELSSAETAEALLVDDLQGVFVLFALFMAASVVTFAIELFSIVAKPSKGWRANSVRSSVMYGERRIAKTVSSD